MATEMSMQHVAEASFHGVEYVLSWTANDNQLSLDLEDANNFNERWYSELDAKYVEDITRKTGSFKRFPIFCKMLHAAMTGPSDTLYADILTIQDLEMLKARQLRGAGGTSPSHSRQHVPPTRPGTGASKRYLIVTYVTEFDRVHYPLPLALCVDPTPAMLKRTIARIHARRGRFGSHYQEDTDPRVEDSAFGINLNGEEASNHAQHEHIAKLEAENERLRELLRKNKALKRKTKAVSAMSEEVQLQLEEEREQWVMEREVLEEEIKDLREELNAIVAEDRQVSRTMDQQTLAVNKENRVLREKVASLEQSLAKERDSHKRVQDRRKRELENTLQELNRLRASNRQLRSRVRDQTTARPTSGGTTARSRSRPRVSKPAGGTLKTGTVVRGRARSRSTSAQSRGGRSVSSAGSQNSQDHPRTRAARTATRTTRRDGAPPRRVRSKSPRFDPTAYQREKEAKRKQLDQARRRAAMPASPRARNAGAPRASPSPRSRYLNGTASTNGRAAATASRTTRTGATRRLHLNTSSGYLSADSAGSRLSAGSRKSNTSRISRSSKASKQSKTSATSKSSARSKSSVSKRNGTPRSVSSGSESRQLLQGHVKKSGAGTHISTATARKEADTGANRPSSGRSQQRDSPNQSRVPSSGGVTIDAPLGKSTQFQDNNFSHAVPAADVSAYSNTADTSVEMDDIDKRLAQLQTFLKQEKAKASFSAD
mmetsp:Transcript_22089/g.39525  ORF Transcript_22089/g.39525 Transcript_22089/m.39525 type:complete len:714 (+) Transcript_22089:566-2707(+)